MGMFIGIKMGNIIKYANKKEIKNMSLPKEAVKKRMPIFSGKNPKQLLRENFIDHQTSPNEVDKTKEVNQGDNLCDIDRNIDKENQQDTGITESHLSPESETPEEELFRFYSVPRQAKLPNELFGDPGIDCNEKNVAYEKRGAEMIDENDDESVEEPAAAAGAEEDEEEDDLIFHPTHRQAALPAGTYYAVIKEVTAESRVGMYGTFKSIRIRFQIFHDERQVVVNFLAQKDLKPSGKLFKMLKMILGEAPSDGFNLRDLKGEKVVVEVGHRLDSNGDIWEEVLSAEKYSG